MTADRALVVFYDKADLSPVTYVHRTGKDVPTYLRIWRDHPDLAGLTLPQTSALFVGICYDHLSATDMAIWTPAKDAVSPHRLTDRAHAFWTSASHGDAGVVLVEYATGVLRCYGGYLTGFDCGSIHAEVTPRPEDQT